MYSFQRVRYIDKLNLQFVEVSLFRIRLENGVLEKYVRN